MSNICCVMKKKNHLQFKDIEKENKGFLKAFPDFSLGPYPVFLRTEPNLFQSHIKPNRESFKILIPPPPLMSILCTLLQYIGRVQQIPAFCTGKNCSQVFHTHIPLQYLLFYSARSANRSKQQQCSVGCGVCIPISRKGHFPCII